MQINNSVQSLFKTLALSHYRKEREFFQNLRLDSLRKLTLLVHKWQQCQDARTFDSGCEITLLT